MNTIGINGPARRGVLLGAALVAAGLPAGAAQLPYRTAVLANNPIVYFEFDEGGGTTAFDTATANGGDNSGTYTGVALNQSSGSGLLGTAVGFGNGGATGNAADDARVQVPANAAFQLGTGPFTVEMWINPTTGGRGDLFTYKGGGGDFGIHEGSNPGGGANISLYHTDGFKANSTALALNQWHHVAVTRDAANAVTIYVDGVVNGTGVDTQSLNITADLIIGKNTGNEEALFQGRIDEFAYYGTALTQADIAAHIAVAGVPEPTAAALLAVAGVTALARRRRAR